MKDGKIATDKRIIYFDILNILACISVIALHCNGCFWSFSYERYWVTSVIIESVCYWAVPIFIMLSGANLIDYREKYDTKTFFEKRIKRTVIPFIFWSLFGILVYRGIGQFIHIKDTFTLITNTKIVPIYWFFPIIFSAYLSIPVINAIPQAKRKQVFEYMIAIGFMTISFLPFFCKFIGIDFNESLSFPITGGYILYVILGYYFSHFDISQKCRIIIYSMGVLGLILHAGGTYFLSINQGSINQLLKGYLNFPTIFYSTAIFIGFRYHHWEMDIKCKRILKKISSASLGIYLIHIYFVDKLPIILHFSNKALEWRTIGVLIVWGICLAIVFVMKKIPLLKNIVP